MGRKRRFANEVVLVAGSQVVGQLANLSRNIVLARVLGPADMGIAAMLGLAMTLLEMISDLAAEEILITDARADQPSLQATLHGLRLIRCVLLALVFASLSPLIIGWFGLPQDGISVAMCAVILLIRGFGHSDIDRAIRERRFRPYAAVQLIPHCVCLLLLAPVTYLLPDYRAVLVLLLVHGCSATLVSHLAADRPYQVGLYREWLPVVWKFAAPILLNGLLLFAVLQGDRFIVGTFYSPTEIGVFVTALGLALIPALLLARVNSTLLLPRLASRQRVRVDLERGWAWAFALISLLSLLSTLGFALLGPHLLPVVYGPAFASGANLIGPLGLAQALFVLRDSLGVVAMASGDTRQPLSGNVVRLFFLPFVAWFASQQVPLIDIVYALVVSEFISLIVGIVRLSRRQRLPIGDMLYPACAVFLIGLGTNTAGTPIGIVAIGAIALGLVLAFVSLYSRLSSSRGSSQPSPVCSTA